MRNFWRKALAACLLAALTLASWPGAEVSALSELEQIAQRRGELQAQLVEINRRLAEIGDAVEKAKEKASTYAARVSIVEQQIEAIQTSVDLKAEELALRQQELENKEQQWNGVYSLFKERLRAMYMSSRTSTLANLLTAGSFGEFLIHAHNVSVISQHDSDMLDRIEAERAEIEEIRAAVALELESLEADRAVLQEKYVELAQLYQEADGALSTAEALQSATEEEYNTAREALRKTDEELNALMGTGSETYVGGYFAWPVPGYRYISSPFGWRPIWGSISWHGGIDISGRNAAGVHIEGADVVASNDGVVIRALYYTTGYGYHVMIDHGGNNWTVYGHLSRILVEQGQYVTQGTVIGKVGTTGNSTGPHLHFEIRLNGEKVNPMEYLAT